MAIDDAPLFAAEAALRKAWDDHDAAWGRHDIGADLPHDHPDVVATRHALHQAGAVFATTPARTLPGLVVKLRYVVEDFDDGRTVWSGPLIHSTLEDAKRLCG